MHEAKFFTIFLEPLNKSGLAYMVTGSVAGIVYGHPRMTHDIDLVIELGRERLSDFTNLFPPDKFYCPSTEVVSIEIARETRGHFNIIHHETGLKADIYPIGKDKLHKWAITRRIKAKIENTDIWLAPPEYVIIRKLQYYKEGRSSKHLSDIKSMLALSSDKIQTETLNQLLSEYGLSTEWQAVQNY